MPPPPLRFFITGTGTGVGKTFAAASLASLLLRQAPCSYIKLVQTGTDQGDDDAKSVQALVPGLPCSCLLRLRAPVSPHLATRLQGHPDLSAAAIVRLAEAQLSPNPAQQLVAEGAGGLAVPINDTEDMVDLCRLLQARAIIVTQATLGTLHHTRATFAYAASRGLPPPLWILNRYPVHPDALAADNLAFISRLFGPPLLILGESSSPSQLPPVLNFAAALLPS